MTLTKLFINILVSALLMLPYMALADPLAEYRWQNRPLLVFAPDSSDARLQQTLKTLSGHDCELTDRHMKILVLLGKGQSTRDDETLSIQDAQQLRARYGLTADDFAVLLVGKDGGEKYRTQAPPDLSLIYALIDGMPMRIDEMNNNPVDCNAPQNQN